MAAELQSISVERILAQWAAAQGEDWSADPHCTFCTRANQLWFNHWATGEILNICDGCFRSHEFRQCRQCLGVGTSFDMTKNSHREPHCPNCRRREPNFGLQ